MKFANRSLAHLLGWLTSIVTLISCFQTALGVTDPTVTLGVTRTNGNVTLAWGSANAVKYQVQTSSTLNNWTNLGPVTTGTGLPISFTTSAPDQSSVFFRVQRVFPAAPGSATFDPVTGVLTVVGDNAHTVLSVTNDGAGNISVNNGAIVITGGVPTVVNTVLIQVLGSAGDDQISIGNSLPPAHLFGAEGNDTLTGGSSGDLIVGGPGNDTVTGRQGNDVIYLGEGNDTFIWNPGDASDFVQGEGGNDTIEFTGSNISENLSLSPNGQAMILFRDVANVTLTSIGVETVNLHALGGADTMTVNSLAGTMVTQVNLDLAAIANTANGDGQVDTVIVNGTSGADTLNVAANGTAVEVTGAGVGALLHVTAAELANDRIAVTGVGTDTVNVNGTALADTMQVLPSPVAGYVRTIVSGYTMPVDVNGALTLSVNGLAGTDTITGTNSLAALNIPIVLDGGDGADTINGGDAAETIIGGPGDDVVNGGSGNDVVFLGDGNDTFIWNPGGGSDTVEGQAGNDTVLFNCSNIGEHVDLSANGSRFKLFRDVANVTLDADGVEIVNLPTLGGADTLTVNSLAGTAVTQVNIDLGSTGGTGDGQADAVIVNGTSAPDTIAVTASSGTIAVTGLSAQVQIAHPEVSLDTLTVNGLGGVDSFSLGAGVTSLMGVVLNQ